MTFLFGLEFVAILFILGTVCRNFAFTFGAFNGARPTISIGLFLELFTDWRNFAFKFVFVAFNGAMHTISIGLFLELFTDWRNFAYKFVFVAFNGAIGRILRSSLFTFSGIFCVILFLIMDLRVRSLKE